MCAKISQKSRFAIVSRQIHLITICKGTFFSTEHIIQLNIGSYVAKQGSSSRNGREWEKRLGKIVHKKPRVAPFAPSISLLRIQWEISFQYGSSQGFAQCSFLQDTQGHRDGWKMTTIWYLNDSPRKKRVFSLLLVLAFQIRSHSAFPKVGPSWWH